MNNNDTGKKLNGTPWQWLDAMNDHFHFIIGRRRLHVRNTSMSDRNMYSRLRPSHGMCMWIYLSKCTKMRRSRDRRELPNMPRNLPWTPECQHEWSNMKDRNKPYRHLPNMPEPKWYWKRRRCQTLIGCIQHSRNPWIGRNSRWGLLSLVHSISNNLIGVWRDPTWI